MVIRDSDLEIRKSAHTAGGISSLGGAISSTIVTEGINSLWDEVQANELSSSVVGEYEVRCVYIYNNSPNNEKFEDVQIYVAQNTVSPYTDIDIALGTAEVGDDEQTVATENTLPLHVFFTFAKGEENAQYVGTLAKGQGKSLWIRRHAGPAGASSSTPSDNYYLGFKIRGTAGSSSPPPPGPPGTPPPGGGPVANDPFGIRMLYPTNPEVRGIVSSPWFMKMSDPLSDVRFEPQSTIARNSDGSWRVVGDTGVRLKAAIGEIGGSNREVLNKAANNLDTYDHSEWAQRGYIFARQDWKNIEITAYYKVVNAGSAGNDSNFNLYSRGIRHSSSVAEGCGGSAYKADFHENNKYAFTKEIFHAGLEPCGDRSERPDPEGDAGGTIGAYRGKWVGLKYVIWNYRRQSDNKVCVHIESWADRDANNTWRKVGEVNDEGNWYPGSGQSSGWYWPTASPACGHNDYKSPNFINVDPDAVQPTKWSINCYRAPDFNFQEYGPFDTRANADAYVTYLKTCTQPPGGTASCPGDTHCGGAKDQILTWGGPWAEFRWDAYVEVHFKNLSVREIIPPSTIPSSIPTFIPT